jgi:beta-lactamase regulating signal transducer with metallopeptidase domain
VEDLFLSVLNMSLTASYVIAAVMLARLFLKKAPKVISYALWAVAGFRLVFPLSFESPFSLIPFKSAPIPADIATQPIPRVDSGIDIIDNVVSSVLPAVTPAASVNPMQVWLTVGACLWLVGMVVMLIYSVVSIVLLKRRLNGAKFVLDNIYKANNLKTPFVLGLFRPKIYIPAGLTEEESRYIILHERMHIRRHDHVVKFLAYLILCLHWFNPFVWAAFLLMSTDMEMSCDERVLKEMGIEMKKAYSMSLLSLAVERRIIGGSPLAFGEGGMKERIKNVLNFKKPSRVIMVAAVALVAIFSVGFAINRIPAVAGDYDFYNFSVNGFTLGADTNQMDTSALTPAEPLHVGDGYDFNYEEVRYGTDANTGRLIKMFVNVYDGAYIPSVTIHKDEGPIYIPHNLNTIEQVINVFGRGEGGWQDREQGLRYMEYRQKEGQSSATVRFVYTNGVLDGITHRLVWVMAESSLPYHLESSHGSSAEPLTFSSNETGLIRLGTLAFDTYMEFLMSEKTPVNERIASYKLGDISVMAGDINQFCVSLNYDFTTDNDTYVNPPRGVKGKGAWPDNYLELRVQHAYEDIYAIVSIGTGGGGQGLTPYPSQQATLEPTTPEWSPGQSLGVDMVSLDYASDDIVIFHGYFGLFVYDLDSSRIIRSLDLKPIKCDATQGDDYCEVSVGMDGNTVQLHRMSSENMYVYTVSDNTLRETPYERMRNGFGSNFVPIEDVIDSEKLGVYSYHAVKLDTGEYGYLHASDWTLGTLFYVRNDMMYRLFNAKESRR